MLTGNSSSISTLLVINITVINWLQYKHVWFTKFFPLNVCLIMNFTAFYSLIFCTSVNLLMLLKLCLFNEWNMGSVRLLCNSVVKIAVCTSKLNTQEKKIKTENRKDL